MVAGRFLMVAGRFLTVTDFCDSLHIFVVFFQSFSGWGLLRSGFCTLRAAGGGTGDLILAPPQSLNHKDKP